MPASANCIFIYTGPEGLFPRPLCTATQEQLAGLRGEQAALGDDEVDQPLQRSHSVSAKSGEVRPSGAQTEGAIAPREGSFEFSAETHDAHVQGAQREAVNEGEILLDFFLLHCGDNRFRAPAVATASIKHPLQRSPTISPSVYHFSLRQGASASAAVEEGRHDATSGATGGEGRRHDATSGATEGEGRHGATSGATEGGGGRHGAAIGDG